MARQTHCSGSWAALAIFTLTSDLNSHFPALWPSHLPHRTPFPPPIYRFSLSLPRLNRLTWPLNSDPGGLPSCQRCWWGSRGKCTEPGPQYKHIKHVTVITTLCQHAKPISWMWVIYYLGMHNISAVRVVSIIWKNTITFILPSK